LVLNVYFRWVRVSRGIASSLLRYCWDISFFIDRWWSLPIPNAFIVWNKNALSHCHTQLLYPSLFVSITCDEVKAQYSHMNHITCCWDKKRQPCHVKVGITTCSYPFQTMKKLFCNLPLNCGFGSSTVLKFCLAIEVTCNHA
jgi:hypothetical protein